jgi:hypothetical protein
VHLVAGMITGRMTESSSSSLSLVMLAATVELKCAPPRGGWDDAATPIEEAVVGVLPSRLLVPTGDDEEEVPIQAEKGRTLIFLLLSFIVVVVVAKVQALDLDAGVEEEPADANFGWWS